MQEQEIGNAMPGPASEIGATGAPAKAKAKWDPKGRRNLIIIGSVVGVAALLLLLLALGGHERKAEPGAVSSVTEATDVRPVAYGMVSQDDQRQLALKEEARVAEAQRTGTSVVSNPVAPSSVIVAPGTLPPAEQHAAQAAGPVANVRMDPGPAALAQQGAASSGVDTDKLKGMSDQMSRMMAAWGMGGEAPTHASTYVREGSAKAAQAQAAQTAGGANGTPQRPADDQVVIPAQEQAYMAETLGPIDTDTPGKLRARIVSGPLTGAVLTGQARRMGTEGFQFDFSSASYKGRLLKVSAYGVDMNTSGDVVEGNYHGRYLERFVFPVLAEGVRAYAGARAQVGTQVIAINVPGGIPTGAQATPAPDAEQARAAMVSAGAGQVSTMLKSGPQQGHITLDVRTPIGIVFEEPIYQSDLAGVPARNNK